MNDRPGQEPQDHHDEGRVDQYPSGLNPYLGQDRMDELGDPGVRPQLGRGQRKHDEQQEYKQRMAQLADVEGIGQYQDRGNDDLRSERPLKDPADLGDHDDDDDDGADDLP